MGSGTWLGGYGVPLVGGGTTTLSRKTRVRVATTGDLPAATLSGTTLTAGANGALAAQDAIALAVGDRLFHLNATTASLRVFWDVLDLGSVTTPWVLRMAADAATSAALLGASDVWVAEGATLADTFWELATDGTITPGTTSLTWTQIAGPGTPGGSSAIYTVDTGVAVLEAVYASAANTADEADATTTATAPCIGFVSSKPTATSAVVQREGELGGFAGLTAGATYYLATTAGTITTTAPTTGGQVVQRVGYAKNTTTLVIELDRDMVVL